MLNHRFAFLLLITVVSACAQTEPVTLPAVTIYSSHVANQEPSGSFAMPVSALSYEPLVDVQARNLAEGQADVSIRGGTFENTGFSIGAVPIYDPQTGHYFAELPVAPAMLGAPLVRTGADNAVSGWNATAGSVAYAWSPIRTGGFASVGAGDNDLFHSELYSGYVSDVKLAGRTLAADASVAHSESDGTRPFGDSNFTRHNARLQLANDVSQTDFFAGYQEKQFGWVNLYTPFNTPETENLRTTLLALNHRVSQGADGDFVEVGAYYRRNIDNYQIPTFAYSAHHTTWVQGAGLEGRVSVADATAVKYRAGAIADDLQSDKLTAGTYHTRTQVYAGVVPEHTFTLDSRQALVVSAGANYDGSNRVSSQVSPVAEIALEQKASALKRLYVSYAETTQLPTYTALNSPMGGGLFRGNPNLGRSISQNFEIGGNGVVQDWAAKAAVFFRRDNNLVDWTYNSALPPTTARVANAVDIDTTGFEAVLSRTFHAVDFVFGYTILHKNANYGSAAVDASFYALNYPDQRLTAAIVARLGAGFELRMDNEGRLQQPNALRRRNDDVVLSSLGLYYVVPHVKGLMLSAQVDNLWNTYYEEVPLVPGARRQFSVGATYGW